MVVVDRAVELEVRCGLYVLFINQYQILHCMVMKGLSAKQQN